MSDDYIRQPDLSLKRKAVHPPHPLSSNNNTVRICPNNADLDSERDKSVTKSVTKAQEILDFVTDTHGWFSYEDVDKELGLLHERDKANRRQVMSRLRKEGIIEAHPRNNKLFRHVTVAVRLIDFKAAGMNTPLAVTYPLDIQNYFQTYPGNLIAIAGAADAGKTAWLLNFIKLNMDAFSIYYQTSEMGAEELANRLKKFDGIGLQGWNFTAEERSRDFADVIRPDCINIVDYLELAGDFYMVAEYLKSIHEKLHSGIAIVALQKKRNAELGRGGDFGLEKPRLYLSMDPGKVTIQKAKNWTDPEVNPNGLVLNFKLVGGCKFIVENDWHKVKDDAKR